MHTLKHAYTLTKLLLLQSNIFFCAHLSVLLTSLDIYMSLFVTQAEERRRGGHSESNGFGNHGNHGNLPDLVQQSNSPSATPTTALQELSDMAEVRHGHKLHTLTMIPVCLCHTRQTVFGFTDCVVSYSLVLVGPKHHLLHSLIHGSIRPPQVMTMRTQQQVVGQCRVLIKCQSVNSVFEMSCQWKKAFLTCHH